MGHTVLHLLLSLLPSQVPMDNELLVQQVLSAAPSPLLSLGQRGLDCCAVWYPEKGSCLCWKLVFTAKPEQHITGGAAWSLWHVLVPEWTLLSLLLVTVVCGGGSVWCWSLVSWCGKQKEDRPCFTFPNTFSCLWSIPCWAWNWRCTSLPQLCSCHQVLALPPPVGCCVGMACWGHLYQLLVARATASHNLLNKPIKWQAGLEPPAAWGSQ